MREQMTACPSFHQHHLAMLWHDALDRMITHARICATLLDTKAGFNPSQPRDDSGRWVDTGASSRDKPEASWGSARKLNEHLKQHGRDFGTNSAREYAKQAQDFLKRGTTDKLPTVIDKQGVVRMYDPATNTFGSYNANGTTRTFYKPTSPTYFERQVQRYGGSDGRVLNMPNSPSGGGGGGAIDQRFPWRQPGRINY
jgi:hypothetical protein